MTRRLCARGGVLAVSLVALLGWTNELPSNPGPVAHPTPGQVQDPSPATPIVVASKPFAESFILAEAFALLLEDRGIPVDRRLGLASTEVIFQAMRAGEVDVYPEYTGTALTAVLGQEASGTASQVFARVSQAFEERWGARWLPPLGFENTYAVAMRRSHADSLGIATLSELTAAAEDMRGGFSPDFIGRPDGLPGLSQAYGLVLRDVRSLLQAVKYEALSRGEVDVIDGYSTDGAIPRFDLRILTDDRGFFPPYDAAAVVSRRVADGRPEVISALTLLGARIDVALMQAMNRRAEVDGAPIETVAAELLMAVGLREEGGVGDGAGWGRSDGRSGERRGFPGAVSLEPAVRHPAAGEAPPGLGGRIPPCRHPAGGAAGAPSGRGAPVGRVRDPGRRRASNDPEHRSAGLHDSALRDRRVAGRGGSVPLFPAADPPQHATRG